MDVATSEGNHQASNKRWWHKYSLDREDPHFLESCQWETETRPSLIFVVYRWTVFMCMLGIAITSLVDYETWGLSGTWFVYWTHWCILVQVVHFGLAAHLSTLAHMRTKGKDSSSVILSTEHKFLCVSATISCTTNIAISIMYWIVLYDATVPVSFPTTLTHGVNGLLALTDLLVTARRTKMYHIMYLIAMCVIYTVFSVIYWSLGGRSAQNEETLYPSFTEAWGIAATVVAFPVVSAFVLTATHVVVYCITQLRIRLATRCLIPSINEHNSDNVIDRKVFNGDMEENLLRSQMSSGSLV